MSTFSPNIQLEEVARNADVGTWDTPTNNNWTLMDSVCGALTTISLNNSNVILSAAQFQSKTLIFNSTLTGSVSITFPTSFLKSYEIYNTCTGSSAFTITLGTTGGGQVICAPPGEIIDCVNNGPHIFFKNLGRVGEYVDYAGTAVPNWVSGCSVPPYLNCNGTTFSGGTYPALAALIGTTLPDTRGRTRYAADAGTGRINLISLPNTVGGAGGDQNTQAHSHANTATVTDPGHVHGGVKVSIGDAFQGGLNPLADAAGNTASAVTGISVTVNNASFGSGGSQNLPPLYIGGITMIRAA